MKKIIYSIILTALCCIAHGQTTKRVSEKYGYTIDIPNSFFAHPSKNKNIDLNFTDSIGSAIIVNVSPRQPDEYTYTVHDYTKKFLEDGIKPTNPTFTILKTEKLFISGEKAFLIIFTASAYDIKSMECYIYHKDKAYVITCSASPSDFSKYEMRFLTLIKSLKLSK